MKKLSKQAQAKIDQGFRKQPNQCGNCKHFESEIISVEYSGWDGKTESYPEERSKRCALGGFAVGKSNVCNKFESSNE